MILRIAAFAAVLALGAPAFAQATDADDQCRNEERHLSPVDQIDSCTTLTKSKDIEDRIMGYGLRGETQHRIGRNQEALADYSEALKLRPTDYGYEQRGELYDELGQPEKALADFDAGLKLAPKNGRLYLYRSDMRLQLKQYPGAIADADKASELSPQSSIGHNGRCWKRAVANTDLDVGRKACDEALRTAVDDEDKTAALDSRGVIGLRQKRWADALKDFSDAVALTPAEGRVMYGKGVAEMRLGKTAEGQADMKKGLSLFPPVAGIYRDFELWP